MKKVLVFGSTGMIGHVIYNYLDFLGQYTLYSSSAHNKISKETYLVDARDHDKIRDCLEIIKPDYVINCAGLLIEESEKRTEDAILINSFFPNMLSRLGRQLNFKLIQISTDCVFSGNAGNYSEKSFQDGPSVYARTKTLGEINNNRDLTIRTSTIGPELQLGGSGLLNWFLNQSGEVSGFDNVFWSGVTSLELAKAVDVLIDQDVTGLYNLTSTQKISKHNLLLLIQKVWKKTDVIIKPYSKNISDRSLCNLRSDFKYKVKKYEEMLIESYEWILNNKTHYMHYFI